MPVVNLPEIVCTVTHLSKERSKVKFLFRLDKSRQNSATAHNGTELFSIVNFTLGKVVLNPDGLNQLLGNKQ